MKFALNLSYVHCYLISAKNTIFYNRENFCIQDLVCTAVRVSVTITLVAVSKIHRIKTSSWFAFIREKKYNYTIKIDDHNYSVSFSLTPRPPCWLLLLISRFWWIQRIKPDLSVQCDKSSPIAKFTKLQMYQCHIFK